MRHLSSSSLLPVCCCCACAPAEQIPAIDSPLVLSPADGTANSAVIEKIDRFGPGVTLLTVRSTTSLDDTTNEDTDLSYVMPCIDRQHCDCDQHVFKLTRYTESLAHASAGTAPGAHVAVPFAEEPDLVNCTKPREVIWEGRIFDDRIVSIRAASIDTHGVSATRWRSVGTFPYCLRPA